MSMSYFEKQNRLFGREVSTPENSPAAVISSTSNTNSVGTIPMVSQEIVEAEGIGDTFKPYSNTSTKPKEIKKSCVEENILKAFANLNKNYKLGLNANNCIEFISEACNKSIEAVKESSAEELQKYVQHIEETIAAMKEDNLTLSFDNIKYNSKKYAIDLSYGWSSIASFRKANEKSSESVTTRLERYSGKKLANLTPQELAETIKSYFTHYDKSCNDGTLKGLLKETYRSAYKTLNSEAYAKDIKKLQETDFVKLLHNSSPEEFELLRSAIQYLEKDSQMRAVCDMLKSFKNINDATTYASEVLTPTELKKYEAPTVECAKEKTEIKRYLNEQATRSIEYAESREAHEFYQCYGKQLVELKEKLKANPNMELSPIEKAILAEDAKIQELRASAPVAILTNHNHFDKNTSVSLLEETNVNTYSISQLAGGDFYRNVLRETAVQIQNNAENLNMSVEEATAMIDATTRGNYSTIINDAKKGTKTELVAHTTADAATASKILAAIENHEGKYTSAEINKIVKEVIARETTNKNTTQTTISEKNVAVEKISESKTYTETKYNTVSEETTVNKNNSIGFTTKPIANNTTTKEINKKQEASISNKSETIQNNCNSEVVYAIRENGVEGFKTYVKENGAEKTILEVLNDPENIPTYFKELALNWYKKNKNRQLNLLTKATNTALAELLPRTNENILLKNKGKKFSNTRATQLFEDAVKETEKKYKEKAYAC